MLVIERHRDVAETAGAAPGLIGHLCAEAVRQP
jgi:hypothetical protein